LQQLIFYYLMIFKLYYEFLPIILVVSFLGIVFFIEEMRSFAFPAQFFIICDECTSYNKTVLEYKELVVLFLLSVMKCYLVCL